MAEAVKSADRALRLMELLGGSRSGLTFSEICSHLSLPKSSAHALLTTMVQRRFVEQEPGSGRYVLGMRLWELANRSVSTLNDLASVANPYMTSVRDAVNETVELAILDGTDVVYIGKCETQQLLTLVSRVGARLPAHATAVGKALLSTLDQAEVQARFANYTFTRYTPNTLGSLRALQNELASVRELGYSEARGDYTEGVHCVAMPVFGHGGSAVAAMSTSVPTNRSSPETLGLMARELDRAVRALSVRLGHVDAPAPETALPM